MNAIFKNYSIFKEHQMLNFVKSQSLIIENTDLYWLASSHL